MIEVRARAIGAAAKTVLEGSGECTVIGQTSRGLFLSNAAEKIVFISSEIWRGPLTVNLVHNGLTQQADFPIHLKKIPNGSPARFYPDRILLHNSWGSIAILTSDLQPWQAEWVEIGTSSFPYIFSRLRVVARLYHLMRGNWVWYELLPEILGQSRGDVDPGGMTAERQILNQIIRAWGDDALEKAANLLGRLLGCGNGLTPAGDDLVIGFLLGITCLKGVFLDVTKLDFFRRNLIPMAQQKTTSISARLIECAGDGQADERIISALVGIVKGNLSESECAGRLAAYGSSSGGDTLVGFALALNALRAA